jgi:hypothetical protein
VSILFGGLGKVYNIPDRNALKRCGCPKGERQILLLVNDNRKQEFCWQVFHALEVRQIRAALVTTTLALEVRCVIQADPSQLVQHHDFQRGLVERGKSSLQAKQSVSVLMILFQT